MKNGKKRFFVTGTDTDAGKTYITVGLLKAAHRKKLRSLGLKPIAAGATWVGDELINDDGLKIQQASSVKLSYSQINPVVFESAIAPHIASLQDNKVISVNRLEGFIRGALLNPSEFVLVEGAGGWKVPLNDRELISDLAKSLNFPVVMVVNMKLGCINHALLTIESIKSDGLSVAGWVANSGQSLMPSYSENLMSLQAMISAPFLGALEYYEHEIDSESAFDSILSQILL
ncbi:dethiobiotin synthase [Marinomonas sp. 2405UD68-3]|uniref:dethiobiotin synthase n=1 Tax=Marinomonas sp. 2405UD68-3 TaxID=3391835 RepID=UPI0039C9CE45